MNKHYMQALILAAIAALAAKEIEASEDEVKDVLENDVNATGIFEDDLAALVAQCEDISWDDEDDDDAVCDGPLSGVVACKENVEENIDKIINGLKIGYNFIPGIGAGWCRNEDDLEKMKDFVRGALTVQAMSCPCAGYGA